MIRNGAGVSAPGTVRDKHEAMAMTLNNTLLDVSMAMPTPFPGHQVSNLTHPAHFNILDTWQTRWRVIDGVTQSS